MSEKLDTKIARLGKAGIPSPLELSNEMNDDIANYVDDGARVVVDPELASIEAAHAAGRKPDSFELAGPREMIYFDPSKLRVAIVTCGGLCPGMNDVLRGLVMQLYHRYGVRRIYGVMYGLQGFIPRYKHELIDLTPERVTDVYLHGGTVLGSSRGPQDVVEIVDALERWDVKLLFCIGGDGTLRAARAIHDEIVARDRRIGIIGIPKTIDNDIPYVERTFGFETAVAEAGHAIRAAHEEARGAPMGIGLVKLMGRNSGYVAASAALAAREANLVLVPELDFDLEGPGGLIDFLRGRLVRRGHALVVVAEGSGQRYVTSKGEAERDASGNLKLRDIGAYLAAEIPPRLKALGIECVLKYIDPSYIIRAAPAGPGDSIFCGSLADHAVHAGMSGRTGMVVGLWGGRFTHVPLALATSRRKVIDLDSLFWLGVLEATGQPHKLRAAFAANA